MIRFVFRWAFRFLVLLVVLIAALVLCKNILLKSYAEYRIRADTGMDAKIGAIDLGLFTPTLTVEGFTLYNRPEFGGLPLVDIPDLYVLYDRGALLRGQLHLRLLRLSVSEVNIVEAQDGHTNLVLALDAGALAPVHSADLGSIGGWRFGGIDTLNLTLNRVKYSSLRHPEKTTELKVGLKHEVLTNVRSLADLTNVIMTAMLRNGITISESPADRRKSAPPDRGKSPRKPSGAPK